MEDERFPGCVKDSRCVLLFGHDGGCVGRRSDNAQEALAWIRRIQQEWWDGELEMNVALSEIREVFREYDETLP